MLEILHQYLIQNKSLSLPGVGTLQLQHIPAISNFSDHMIQPPMHKVVFDDTQDAPSKSLFQYIAVKMGIEEWEAIKKVNDFSYELKNQLKQGKEIVWHKIGTLKAEPAGSIALETAAISYDFMEPVPAIRVIRSNTNHLILRGDREVSGSFTKDVVVSERLAKTGLFKKWWVWAAIFAATALILLFTYYYNNGFELSHFFNTQKAILPNTPSTYK